MYHKKEKKSKYFNLLNTLIMILFFMIILPSLLIAEDFNNEADFVRIYTNTIKGDIAATGSPVLCATEDGDTCDWNYQGYLFDITPLALHDGNITVFPKNSGGAILNLPSDVNGSDILWAKLYWQGHIFGLENNNSSFSDAIKDLNKVTMLDPQGGVHYLTANQSEIYYYGYNDKNVSGTNKKGYRYFYQASVDVTNIVRNSYTPSNKYFIVGNINTTLTKDIYYIRDTKLGAYVKWGNWGGWTLAVAYKRPNASLKSINFYQGFKFLLPPFGGTASLEISLPPDSFYTPNHGTVKSKTLIFAAGAEKKIARDKLEVYSQDNGYMTVFNTLNPADNQINDSITYLDSEINATRIFNPGTDIDTFDTSNILSNGQTTTKVRVTMSAYSDKADQAFVGLIGISNDVYEPRVCYYIDKIESVNGKVIYENGAFTDKINPNTKYKASFWISNMKKDINDTNIEDAKKVRIYLKYNDFNYTRNSTYIKNIGDSNFSYITDDPDDDIGEFLSDENESIWNLGEGATSSSGGTFVANVNNSDSLKAFEDINGTFLLSQDSNQTVDLDKIFKFSAVLKTDYLTIDTPMAIPKCQEFNTTGGVYAPAPGTFNVVNENFTGNSDPLAQTDPKNTLYTQVVKKPFQIKVLHLKNNKTDLDPYEGVVFLKVVDATNISSAVPNSCINAPELYTPSTDDITKDFDSKSFIDVNMSIPKAIRNATFKIGYIDWNTAIDNSGVVCVDRSTTTGNLKGVPQCLNSEDKIQEVFSDKDISECLSSGPNGQNAACEPSNYDSNGPKVDIQPSEYNNKYGCAQCLTEHVGSYICARDNFAVRPDEFNISISQDKIIAGRDFNITFIALDYNNTPTDEYNETKGNSFEVNASETKTGCKDGNLSIDNFSFSDGNASDINASYNEVGVVNIKIHEINGSEFAKVDANDSINPNGLQIKPAEINATFIPHHFDLNAALHSPGSNFAYISSDLNMSAILDINVTAKNEQNITTKNYNKNCYAKKTNYHISYADLNITPSGSLNKLIYLETNTSKEGNISINSDINLTDINETIFGIDHNGTGSIHLKINFDRNASKIVNPFILNIKDINVTDKDDVNGTRSLDKNETFYYGRVHAPDYETDKNSTKTPIYAEVYCNNDEVNCSEYNITNWQESKDDVNWWINKLHSNQKDGNVSLLTPIPNTYINITSYSGFPLLFASGINNSVNITYNGNSYPHKIRVNVTPSSWLKYNKFNPDGNISYDVTFKGSGDWAGIGKTGKTVDMNISKKTSKRIEW